MSKLMKQLLGVAEQHGKPLQPQAFIFQSRSRSALERKVCREALERAVNTAQPAEPDPTLHDLGAVGCPWEHPPPAGLTCGLGPRS